MVPGLNEQKTSKRRIENDVKKLARYSAKLLAEKVENESELSLALDLGFHYFQGNYFAEAENFIQSRFLEPPGVSNQRQRAQMPDLGPAISPQSSVAEKSNRTRISQQ